MRVSKHQGGAECLVLRNANLALVRHFHSKPVNFGQNLGFVPSLAKYAVSRKPPKMLYLYRFLCRARNRCPGGLAAVNDYGQHVTIFPEQDMPFSEFQLLLNRIPWH